MPLHPSTPGTPELVPSTLELGEDVRPICSTRRESSPRTDGNPAASSMVGEAAPTSTTSEKARAPANGVPDAQRAESWTRPGIRPRAVTRSRQNQGTNSARRPPPTLWLTLFGRPHL